MMEKIIYQTTATLIGNDGYIRPRSPLWSISNFGLSDCFVNELKLAPHQRFGVDATNLFLAGDNVEIINETEFFIKFKVSSGPVLNKCILIETFFKRIKI